MACGIACETRYLLSMALCSFTLYTTPYSSFIHHTVVMVMDEMFIPSSSSTSIIEEENDE